MNQATEPTPLKPYKTYAEQLQLLKDRGLIVEDEAGAMAALARLGYYRLSGYFYPLRKTKPVGQEGRLDEFQDRATFELIVALAQFDKKLRLLALYAIETVEIGVRVAVSHRLGKIHPEAHLIGKLLDGKFVGSSKNGGKSKHEEWIERFDRNRRDSREDFLGHHNGKYDGRMPIWVAIELWDFGLLSRFIAGMQHRDQAAIAQIYGLDGAVLKSWIRMFNFVRNVSAHHSRLWNRTTPEIPLLPPLDRCRWLEPLHRNDEARTKIFGALTCLRLMMRSIAPHSTWHQQLKEHVGTFPESDLLSIRSAGFPDDWRDSPIWRDADAQEKGSPQLI